MRTSEKPAEKEVEVCVIAFSLAITLHLVLTLWVHGVSPKCSIFAIGKPMTQPVRVIVFSLAITLHLVLTLWIHAERRNFITKTLVIVGILNMAALPRINNPENSAQETTCHERKNR